MIDVDSEDGILSPTMNDLNENPPAEAWTRELQVLAAPLGWRRPTNFSGTLTKAQVTIHLITIHSSCFCRLREISEFDYCFCFGSQAGNILETCCTVVQ